MKKATDLQGGEQIGGPVMRRMRVSSENALSSGAIVAPER